MKKYWLVSIAILVTILMSSLEAQVKQMPFFQKNGTPSIQTTEMKALADTIAVINHRADDVVWSRILYRIIDMRDKQNYQLYFPSEPNEQYKSLFRLMLDASINDSLRAYDKVERDILPLYNSVIPKDSLVKNFTFCDIDSTDVNNKRVKKNLLIEIDPITNKPAISKFNYNAYVKNQFKFLIQEIVFFDKHTSRMYSKIMAIAPLYALNETNVTFSMMNGNNGAWPYFQSSVICWFAYDELRPYLARQYVIPNGNETQRLTFDEFFAQKLYSSYLLGESNMSNRMLLQSESNPEKIRKEQHRIDTELLNFEEDLWEY